MSRPYLKACLLVASVFLVVPCSSHAQREGSTSPPHIGAEAFEVMRQFFEYDRGIPLDARVVDRVENESSSREKIVFTGISDSRVPGYLAIPVTGESTHPCVLVLHGIDSTKEDWWKDESFPSGGLLSKSLLASGFAVLALDAEYHGERLSRNDYESSAVFTFEKEWIQRARSMIVQSTIEYRRAMDYLATRPEIDTSRIGVVGYSMGGIMAFALAAVDERVVATVASVTPILEEPYSPIAVHNLAPFSQSSAFLMLMGSTDVRNYSPEDARRLHGLLASETKEIIFYDSGHKLPVEWTRAAAEWIEKHLEE